MSRSRPAGREGDLCRPRCGGYATGAKLARVVEPPAPECVVVEQREKSLLSPQVKVFFSTRSNARILPELIDLAQPGCRLKIVSREDPAKWRFPDLNEIWSGLAAVPR